MTTGLAYLPVGVLDGRDVALAERSLDEPEDQGTLADATGPKHHLEDTKHTKQRVSTPAEAQNPEHFR